SSSFFFHPPPPSEFFTLSLHDALPIWRASTSFSSRVNSISFCRNTSYTFFIARAPVRIVFGCGSLSPNFSRVACVVKRFRTQQVDRKSTRLNSSHLVISYAVFCLKKKI